MVYGIYDIINYGKENWKAHMLSALKQYSQYSTIMAHCAYNNPFFDAIKWMSSMGC
jgi:hypothetical protein